MPKKTQPSISNDQDVLDKLQSTQGAADSGTEMINKTEGKKSNGDTKESDQTAVQTTGQEEVTETKPKKKAVAKAGKRSEKALKEADEKQAKEERKAQKAEEDDKPKQTAKPARSRLERRGKNFRKAAELFESDKQYGIKEAIELAIKTSLVKFDATVELHINLNVDPRHADQNIRDNLVLPAGTGKNVRVAVMAEGDDEAAAKKAGADVTGADAILKDLDKGIINFDSLIATPSMMPKLGKYARTLGPKGLMPNPKSGTVTADVAKAVGEAKAGRVEYRVDSTGIVHLGIGKVSFGTDKLLKNAQAVFASVKSNKPASVKGSYVKAIHVTTSMGPGITVSTTEL